MECFLKIEHHSCVVNVLDCLGELDMALSMINRPPNLSYTILAGGKNPKSVQFGKQRFNDVVHMCDSSDSIVYHIFHTSMHTSDCLISI